MRSLRGALVWVVVAEIAVFSASFGKYFCGDSLFFFSRTPLFTRLDDLSTYRPLTVWIFQHLMLPIGDFHPMPYHVIALAAHLATTVLVYLLLKRVGRSDAGVIAGLVCF